MKTSNLSGIKVTILLAALLALATPNVPLAANDAASADDVRQETAELLQALKSYGAGQREQALEKSRAALEAVDRRIEALEASLFEHWDEMDLAAREQARDSLQALRDRRTRVAEWYGSMKSGSEKAWGQVRQGFSNAYQALHDAWEKSAQQLESGDRQ